jgi:hypothetical protein
MQVRVSHTLAFLGTMDSHGQYWQTATKAQIVFCVGSGAKTLARSERLATVVLASRLPEAIGGWLNAVAEMMRERFERYVGAFVRDDEVRGSRADCRYTGT